jgi:hypothetical protein
MPLFQDLSGQQFGRLTVIGKAENHGKRTAWECRCICGKVVSVTSNLLKVGKAKSCGCLRKEVSAKRKATHGKGYECREYRSWNAAKKRCYTKSNEAYKNYGALGVKMCPRWEKSFENFLLDMGECPPSMTLDRINPFGDYEPSNCRWADKATQAKNTRKHWEGEM